MKHFHYLIFVFFVFNLHVSAQQIITHHLKISNSGQTGLSGTNWSIVGNTLQIAASGGANIHPSVITNHLTNTGDLTIVIPKIIYTFRNIIIENSIIFNAGVARNLVFNSPNHITISSNVVISSTGFPLNLVFRTVCLPGAPDQGMIKMNDAQVATFGGHIWMGGGSTDTPWNGLTVGNHQARTWSDNEAGVGLTSSNIVSSGGNIYIGGYNHNAGPYSGDNYGVSIVDCTLQSAAGNLVIDGILGGNFATGAGTKIQAQSGNVNITATSGSITITGFGSDVQGVGVGSWRHGLIVMAENGTGKCYISTATGNMSLIGTAQFSNSTINDCEGVYIGGNISTKCVNLNTISGTILIEGSNSRSYTGQFCNGVRFVSGNEAGTISKAISIGYNGYNTCLGNVIIRSNDILQYFDSAAQTIEIVTSGSLTIEPLGNNFTNLRAGINGSLTFNSNWYLSPTISYLRIGKSGSSLDLTLNNVLSVAGGIQIFSGTLTLNANLMTTNTNTGNIFIKGNSIVGSGAINLAWAKILTIDLSSNSTFNGAINGSNANLIKSGAGITTLSAACSYTGTTNINGGTLQFNENKTFAGITIAANATLALGPNKQFDFNGALVNNGTLNIKSGATLLNGGSNAISGSGSYVVEQAITGTNSGGTPNGRFWYLGSPVVGAFSTAYNAGGPNVLKYRDEPNNQWLEITNDGTSLNVGQGYYCQVADNSTLSFAGTALNNGAISISGLSRTTGVGYEGFNLVSNPYPSYLDWDAVTKTNVGNTMWYRTASGSTAASMVFETYVAGAAGGIGTNLSGNTATKWIPPMQSFWVRVSQGQTSGSLALDNTMRSHFASLGSSTAGLRSTNDELKLFLRMNLLQDAKKDQLIVYVNGNATNGFDVLDGEKMMQATLPQFYTSAAGKKITINGLNSAKKQQSLPITMELPTTGVHSFQIEDLEIDNGLVWLEDKQEETMQALEPGSVYEFYANSGINAERFVLHFQIIDDATPVNVYNEVGSFANFSGKGASVHAEAAGVVVIKLPATTEGITDIQIRDAAGKLVYSGSTSTLETSVQLTQANGIYYVTLNSTNGVEVRKVFVQQ